MQTKVRHHRIRLYPYDITAPGWSLPPISPGPTPLAILSHTPRSTSNTGPQRRPKLRKIHLIALQTTLIEPT